MQLLGDNDYFYMCHQFAKVPSIPSPATILVNDILCILNGVGRVTCRSRAMGWRAIRFGLSLLNLRSYDARSWASAVGGRLKGVLAFFGAIPQLRTRRATMGRGLNDVAPRGCGR